MFAVALRLCLVITFAICSMAAAAHPEARERFHAGDTEAALALLEQAWQVHLDSGRDGSPAALAVLFDRGVCHQRLGQLGQARLLFERALSGFEALQPPDEPALVLVLEGLTAVLAAQENTVEAGEHLERAQAISQRLFGPVHPQTARLHALEARLARLAGQPEAAHLAMHEARMAYRRIHGNLHPVVATLTRNDIDLFLEMQNPRDAWLMAHQADFITREVFGATAPERVASLSALGRVHWALQDHAESAAAYREALTILDAHRRVAVLEVTACEAGLGRAHLAGGDPAGALAALTRAAAAYEQAWWLAGESQSRATFMASPYPLLAAAELLTGARGSNERAWTALEEHHGRTLKFAEWSRLLTPAEQARRDSLQQRSLATGQRIERLAIAGDPDVLAALRREQTDLQAALLSLDASLQARLAGSAQHGRSVPERIPVGTALLGWLDVEIAPGAWRSWAWVITGNHGLTWVPLSAGGQVRELAQAHRATLVGDADDVDGVDSARRLFHLRLAPVLPLLHDVETLVVVPGETMAGLPLATLTDQDGRQILDRWSVALTPRIGPQTTVASAQPSTSSLLALADPPFQPAHAEAMRAGRHRSDPSALAKRSVMADALRGRPELLTQLVRLPGTRGEVEAVSRLFASSDLLIGEEARMEALRQRQHEGRLASYDVIHLATHALVDAQRPERSALVFSLIDLPTGETDPGAGLLFAGEIAAAWRLDADLVTLSACETGLGRPVPGEGYLGFTQAFLTAGARSVLVSLWQVDDRATALLMERFYENRLRHGLGKAASLREAQRWLRDHEVAGRRPYEHPRYWGGFVLVGEP